MMLELCKNQELMVALQAALAACREIMTHYRSTPAQQDVPVDVVSEADLAAEKIIMAIIRDHFPQDEFCTEESYPRWPKSEKRIWIIDPLDGSKAYCQKTGKFCSQLALYHEGWLKLAVIADPLTARIYIAAKDQGAFCDDRVTSEALAAGDYVFDPARFEPIVVSSQKNLEAATILISSNSSQQYERAIQQKLQATRMQKSFSLGLKMAYVAIGEVDLYTAGAKPYKIWDWAPGKLLVEEAGGVVSDSKGQSLRFGEIVHDRGLLVGNGDLHRQALIALSGKYDQDPEI